jgi:putative transposase
MIRGQRQYLWRAGDQDGEVIDILLQPRRDSHAAERFLRKLLTRSGRAPHRLVIDRLGSYRAAHRIVMPSAIHDTRGYDNSLAEVSHEPARQRERAMRGFKSRPQAQRLLTMHGVVRNLFGVGRHRLPASHHRQLRSRAFETRNAVAAA